MYSINSLPHKPGAAILTGSFACLFNESLSFGPTPYDPSCKKKVKHKQNKTTSMQKTMCDSTSWI